MTVLYEDNHIIAVNKTCHEIVQGDKTGDATLIDAVKAYIKERYNKPGEVFLGVPHRLDRPTSGVVVFARTSKALARLCDMFKDHGTIQKTYWAIVANRPKENEATLEHWLVRREEQNKTFVVKPDKQGNYPKEARHASLSYKLIAESERYFLLEIKLHTGRHHQIRCQLAAIGCPIKGDLKYGYPRSNPDGGISLHARSITFVHPVSKQLLTITAPVPEDNLWQVFSSL